MPGSKWSVKHLAATIYVARCGEDQNLVGAHCLACAKLHVFSVFLVDVDLRGWHKQGECGEELRKTVTEGRKERKRKNGREGLSENE